MCPHNSRRSWLTRRELQVVDLTACEFVNDIDAGLLLGNTSMLRELRLTKCHNIPTKTLRTVLANNAHLETLSLSGPCIDNTVLAAIATTCRELRVLSLLSCSSVSIASVWQLLDSLSCLVELDLSLSTGVIAGLAGERTTVRGPYSSIRTLHLSDYTGDVLGSLAVPESIALLRQRFPSVETLYSVPWPLPWPSPSSEPITNITTDVWLTVWRSQPEQLERLLQLRSSPYQYGYDLLDSSSMSPPRSLAHSLTFTAFNRSLAMSSPLEASCWSNSLQLATILAKYHVIPVTPKERTMRLALPCAAPLLLTLTRSILDHRRPDEARHHTQTHLEEPLARAGLGVDAQHVAATACLGAQPAAWNSARKLPGCNCVPRCSTCSPEACARCS